MEQDTDGLPLSRTRKKKQAKEVELVAAQLAGLSESRFAQLDLPEEIIDEANRVRETRGRSFPAPATQAPGRTAAQG